MPVTEYHVVAIVVARQLVGKVMIEFLPEDVANQTFQEILSRVPSPGGIQVVIDPLDILKLGTNGAADTFEAMRKCYPARRIIGETPGFYRVYEPGPSDLLAGP